MSIKESLQHDLTEAIRSRDELTSGTIRMVLTAITMEEVAGKEARELVKHQKHSPQVDVQIAQNWKRKRAKLSLATCQHS